MDITNEKLDEAIEKLDRPINITVEVGGEEFDAHIIELADGNRIEAEKRDVGELPTT